METNSLLEPSSQIYESIYKSHKAEDIENNIIRPIARAINAKSASFVQFYADPMGEASFGLNRYIGRHPAVMSDFFNKFHPLCPWTRSVTKQLKESDHVDELLFADSFPNAIERDLNWRDNFLAHYGIVHFAGILLPIYLPFETHVAAFAFHRPREDPAFSPAEIEYIQRVSLAIKPTLHMIASAQARAMSQAIEIAYNKIDEKLGFLILDEDLMIRHANARGMKDANASSPSPPGSKLLGEVKKNLLSFNQNSGSGFIFQSEETGPVEVEIHNISVSAGRIFHLVLTAVSKKSCPVGNSCRQFGLTNRERDVVEGIVAGKQTAEFSRELGISERTGENHLRSIYRKVGVNSRTQLLSKIYLLH